MRAWPVWPVWTLAGSGRTPVSQWKTVLLPEPAKPAMPTFIAMFSRPPVPAARASGGKMEARPPHPTVQSADRSGQRIEDLTMTGDLFQTIQLPLSPEQFRRLPRNAAYKYELIGGETWLTPPPRWHHAVL